MLTPPLICILLMSFVFANAQHRQSINTGGKAYLGTSYYINQSIGQDAAFSQTSYQNRYIAQGFQQPITRHKLMLTDQRSSFVVFPNPTTGAFTIEWDDALQVNYFSLYDAKGVQMTFEHQQSTNYVKGWIEPLPQGVYFLQLIDNTNKTKVIKIIKTTP